MLLQTKRIRITILRINWKCRTLAKSIKKPESQLTIPSSRCGIWSNQLCNFCRRDQTDDWHIVAEMHHESTFICAKKWQKWSAWGSQCKPRRRRWCMDHDLEAHCPSFLTVTGTVTGVVVSYQLIEGWSEILHLEQTQKDREQIGKKPSRKVGKEKTEQWPATIFSTREQRPVGSIIQKIGCYTKNPLQIISWGSDWMSWYHANMYTGSSTQQRHPSSQVHIEEKFRCLAGCRGIERLCQKRTNIVRASHHDKMVSKWIPTYPPSLPLSVQTPSDLSPAATPPPTLSVTKRVHWRKSNQIDKCSINIQLKHNCFQICH